MHMRKQLTRATHMRRTGAADTTYLLVRQPLVSARCHKVDCDLELCIELAHAMLRAHIQACAHTHSANIQSDVRHND